MSELSQLNTAVLFTNWTNEDFTWNWDGKPYHFRARSSEWISVGDRAHNEGLANHFAKHLTDRELNKRKIPTDHFIRTQYESNCFLPLESTKPVPVAEVEIHKDTGLIQAVRVTGDEDVKTGKVTPREEVVVVEEPKVESTPVPLGTVVEESNEETVTVVPEANEEESTETISSVVVEEKKDDKFEE